MTAAEREGVKRRWWEHFLRHVRRGPGLRTSMLLRHEVSILGDERIWMDVIERHGGGDPWVMRDVNPDLYEHCISNMRGLVREHLDRSSFAEASEGKLEAVGPGKTAGTTKTARTSGE